MRRSYAASAATALSAISVREVALRTSSRLQENLNELHLSDSELPADHAAGFQFKLQKRHSSTKLAPLPQKDSRIADTGLLTAPRNAHWYIRRTTSSTCY